MRLLDFTPSRRSKIGTGIMVMLCTLAACQGCTNRGDAPDEKTASADVQNDNTGQQSQPNFGALMGDLQKAIANAEAHPIRQNPVASFSGVHSFGGESIDVTVDIYSVKREENYTFLDWSIRNQAATRTLYSSGTSWWYSVGDASHGRPFTPLDRGLQPASYVTLSDAESGIDYYPLQRPVAGFTTDEVNTACMCSSGPQFLTDRPYRMSGYYPSLPDNINSIDLDIAGFGVLKDVPVSD